MTQAKSEDGFFNFNFTPYLPPNAREKLLMYKYHGADKSLIYKYMWKPLCARLVNYLPLWLAPNVITVTALLIVCITHAIILYYMPDMTLETLDHNHHVDATAAPPSWVFVMTGVALFLYQLLDNLDGHQARRTGTSSPLGLLMDHGCDAFNCIVGSLSVASCVCAGPTWKSWTVLITTVIVFFMNTWEEYYRGALILPIINGPNEGILIAICVYFATAIVGPAWWTSNHITVSHQTVAAIGMDQTSTRNILSHFLSQRYTDKFIGATYTSATGDVEVLYNTLMVLFCVFSGVVTCAGNIIQVCRAVRSNEAEESGGGYGKYGSGWLLQRFPFVHALTRLLPLAVISLVANVWFLLSPDNIFQQHPRLFCWTVGLLYTKLAVHLMIAHLCSVEFHPFRRTLVPFFFFAIHIGFTYYAKHELPMIDEEVLLYEFFTLSTVTFAHLAINAIGDTATVLGIRIFTIPYKKKEKQG